MNVSMSMHCTCTSSVKRKTELESRMVKRCVAAGCSNTNADGVSLFKFPKDEKLHALWIKQVSRFRAEWTCTEYSVLCSEHFSDECFEVESKLAAEFGMKRTKRLKADAVPSIFTRSSATSRTLGKRVSPCSNSSESSSKKRMAYEKHENYRVCIITEL